MEAVQRFPVRECYRVYPRYSYRYGRYVVHSRGNCFRRSGATLTANVTTTNFAPQTVTWSSDNPLVTVSASGVVKVDPTATGQANITATSKFDTSKSKTCVITVR